MESKKFTKAKFNLSKAAEIGIESLKKFPPKEYNNDNYKYILKCCIDRLFFINNPEPKHSNLRSLKYLEEEVFTRFQEGSGENVEYFWRRIKEVGLPFKRENKLAKILKRKKINNEIEYDFVTDVMIPYFQEDLITEEELKLLKDYLGKFEEKRISIDKI